MRWAKAIVAQIVGLFVDDGSFAAGIILWVAVIWFARVSLDLSRIWGGVVLFAGLTFILLESTARRSKATRRSRPAQPSRR